MISMFNDAMDIDWSESVTKNVSTLTHSGRQAEN